MKFNNQDAIVLAVYGKIGYGLSLKQMFHTLRPGGLNVITMGAFIGEHSFATEKIRLAWKRPHEDDLNDLDKLANLFKRRIKEKRYLEEKDIPGWISAAYVTNSSRKQCTLSCQNSCHK